MPSFITLGDFNFSKLCSAMRPEEKPWPPTSEGSGVDITVRSAALKASRSITPKLPLTGGATQSRAQKASSPPKEKQLRLQLPGIVPEEAGEAAKMVIMPMAQHKRVQASRLNP